MDTQWSIKSLVRDENKKRWEYSNKCMELHSRGISEITICCVIEHKLKTFLAEQRREPWNAPQENWNSPTGRDQSSHAYHSPMEPYTTCEITPTWAAYKLCGYLSIPVMRARSLWFPDREEACKYTQDNGNGTADPSEWKHRLSPQDPSVIPSNEDWRSIAINQNVSIW